MGCALLLYLEGVCPGASMMPPWEGSMSEKWDWPGSGQDLAGGSNISEKNAWENFLPGTAVLSHTFFGGVSWSKTIVIIHVLIVDADRPIAHLDRDS